MSSLGSGPDTPTGEPPEPRERSRVGLVAAIAVGGTMAVMWIGIFAYHVTGAWEDDVPGRLADPAWSATAEGICATTMDAIDALPPARATPTAEQRADVIEQSNTLLGAMLEDLDAAAPTSGPDAAVIGEWTADWRAFVGDRAEFAVRLRADPDARFYVTQSDRDNRQITQAIDRLANLNNMPSCATPEDLS